MLICRRSQMNYEHSHSSRPRPRRRTPPLTPPTAAAMDRNATCPDEWERTVTTRNRSILIVSPFVRGFAFDLQHAANSGTYHRRRQIIDYLQTCNVLLNWMTER